MHLIYFSFFHFLIKDQLSPHVNEVIVINVQFECTLENTTEGSSY